MALYGGLDLHGDNVYCALLDEQRRTVFAKRLPNDLPDAEASVSVLELPMVGLWA